MPRSLPTLDIDYSDNRLSLKGHLTMESVPSLDKRLLSYRKQFNDPLTIDLAQTDHNDTAGLAWLINVKAELIKKNITIKVENAPESLKKLSRLSDADKILGLD
jgi:ABC-type transporter Mla MlaB component